MAPGIIILIMYFLAMALTAEVFILERKDGLIDRHVVLFIRPCRLLYLCVAWLTEIWVISLCQMAWRNFFPLRVFG